MTQHTQEGFGLGPAHVHDRGRTTAAKITAWHRHRAVRTCARNARDATDCAGLLDMLGLKAEEGR